MSKHLVSLGLLSALFNLSTVAYSQEYPTFKTKNETHAVLTKSLEAQYPGVPVLNKKDWRTAEDIPWSKIVIVKDDFDGDYVAVFDKNYQKDSTGSEAGIISNWSQNQIRVYAYGIRRQCGLFNLVCKELERKDLETGDLSIRVGEQVFKLVGKNGNYPMNPELATALRNAPSGKAKIRVTLEGSGSTITNDIGEKTVEAWKIVYKPSD
ncbi:hypothetical protein LEP3755_30570 [Leptolyngbya sp. NIES-3755]|nr:hypothetical protein LEP3755_30570 [Leptolyngbya sp. NIES-3755]